MVREGLDLVAYVTLSVFPISYFLLSTYNTPLFSNTLAFSIMLATSLLALLAVKMYMPEIGEEGEISDFDENLTLNSLVVALMVGFGVLALAGLIARLPTQTLIYVPKPNVEVFSIGPISSVVVGNILYQFTLVAPAEECLKTAGIYALHSRLGEVQFGEAISVALPVALWAVFHTILAGFTPLLVATAFAAGLVFYAGQRYTGSILTAILAHAIYNGAVVALSG